MQTRGSLNLKIAILFISIGMSFCAGCLVTPPPPSPEIATLVLEESIISAGIQSALNDYNTGLQENDKSLSLSAIDERNLVVLEAFSASFDNLQRSGFLETARLGMTVIDIEQENQELALAHIKRDRDDWRADWFFRKKDSQWVISEPTITEAGTPQKTTSGNYTFITYPIADNANEKIITLMAKAEGHVRQDLGEVPTETVEVTIYPIVWLSPLRLGALSASSISPVEYGIDRISIVAPASWWFGFYDPQTGWEADIQMVLTHELAWITYVRNFGDPGQGVDWFSEGLAQYVGGLDEMPAVIAAVQNDTIIPIIDTSSSTRKIDLAHFANLDNQFLAHGLSESLVTFIIENYGGVEMFWSLAESYDQSQDMDQALQNTLGIPYEEFDASWREWLKEYYIKR